jgi:hypothetical protein
MRRADLNKPNPTGNDSRSTGSAGFLAGIVQRARVWGAAANRGFDAQLRFVPASNFRYANWPVLTSQRAGKGVGS